MRTRVGAAIVCAQEQVFSVAAGRGEKFECLLQLDLDTVHAGKAYRSDCMPVILGASSIETASL